MSILITGIDMPTKGNSITVAIYPDGTAEWEAQHKTGTAVPVPPHGKLIDADEFLKRAIGTKCFCGDYALMLEELVGESTTIIPAEQPKEEI